MISKSNLAERLAPAPRIMPELEQLYPPFDETHHGS